MQPKPERLSAVTDSILPTTALLLLAALLLALPRLALAADSAEVRRVDGLDVDQVIVHGSSQVEITQGDSPELLVRAAASKLEPPPFHVRGRTLVMGLPAGVNPATVPGVKYKLTLPTLARVELLGSGEVFVRAFATPDMSVLVDGSGDVRLYGLDADRASFEMRGSGEIQVARVQAASLRLSLTGSGDIHLGQVLAESMQTVINGSGDLSSGVDSHSEITGINIVGSGDVNFATLDSDQVQITIVGSGDASVGETRSLAATILGSGDIYYRGDPAIDQTIFGSGRLQRE